MASPESGSPRYPALKYTRFWMPMAHGLPIMEECVAGEGAGAGVGADAGDAWAWAAGFEFVVGR
jgi:hypothetical protein